MVRGLCQSPEGRGIFPGMTVLENLDMGAYTRRDTAGIAADLERVFDLFPRLAERRKQAGGTLSGGEQQMLAVGRALMSRPKLLLLDEPSMGLAPMLIQQIFDDHHRDQRSRAPRSCWWSRTPSRRCPGPTAAYVLETGRIVKERYRSGPAARPGGQGGVPRRGLSARTRRPAVPSRGGRPSAFAPAAGFSRP